MNPQEYLPNYAQRSDSGYPTGISSHRGPMKIDDGFTDLTDTSEENIEQRGPKWSEEPRKHRKKPFWQNYKLLFIAWAIILLLIEAGIYFNLDKFVVGNIVFLFGLLSYAFTGLISVLGLIPFAGPFIVKVLGIPFVWILNGIGYLVSLVAIRRGYSKDVLTYRGYTIAVIIGITIGYIIGKIL